MSIAIGTLVPSGIAISADSRITAVRESRQSSHRGPTHTRSAPMVVTESAQRTFAINKHSACGVAGADTIDGRPVSWWMARFSDDKLRDDYQQVRGEDVVTALVEYFKLQYGKRTTGDSQLDVIVGTYNNAHMAELWRCTIDFAARTSEVTPGLRPGGGTSGRSTAYAPSEPRTMWIGAAQACSRLILGYDLGINTASTLRESPSMRSVKRALAERLSSLEYVIHFQDMQLQDAIDFNSFLIRTTMGIHRFTDGTPFDRGPVHRVGGRISTIVVQHGTTAFVDEPKLTTKPAAGDAAYW